MSGVFTQTGSQWLPASVIGHVMPSVAEIFVDNRNMVGKCFLHVIYSPLHCLEQRVVSALVYTLDMMSDLTKDVFL